MKERKKIKYVEKQPPDKNNTNSTQNRQVQPLKEGFHDHAFHPQHRPKVEESNSPSETYLIQQQQTHLPEELSKNAPRKEENRTKYVTKDNQKIPASFYPKEDHRNRDPRRGEPRRGEDQQGVPRFIERESSHHDMSCIICSEEIRRKDYTWTCSCCYISMHLKCIKEWIKNINQQQAKQSVHIFNWKCPQCNYQYNEPIPKYYCYCGKHLNPEYDRDLPPHSCGQICKRKRGAYCPHPCPDLCHKGKCPACEYEGILVICQCGKSQRVVKCSEERLGFQCGKKCEKILNCHKHKCERNCHAGACQPCKKKKMAECHCGKSSDIVDCIEASYSCGEVCGKGLNCGYHKCEMKCHTGDCNNCRRTPQLQTTCPCGKYSIEMLTGDPEFRKSCAEPIPVCGMPCSKRLDCGHVCPRSCHEGPCPPCKVTVDQNCQCSSQIRKIECHQKAHHPFKCQSVCKRKRSCGNHICNQVCCPHRSSPILENHPCDLNCTKMLNCGKHQCGEPCHIGLCKKCPVIYSQPQPCPCGKTFLKPPIICGTMVPECQNVCDKELSCGHRCKNICHYGNCKCFEDVTVACRCGKEQIKTTCGRQALCLTKCQLVLPCGHKCDLQCHRGTCQEAHKAAPCRKICSKERGDCKHICPQLCHPEQQCEGFPCEAQILVKCECGNRQTMTLCGAHEHHKTKKAIVCNKKCQNLKRFDFFYKDKEIYYPGVMVQFAFKNYPYLQNLEARLEKFILHSDQNFIEVEYKFPDNHSKLVLTDLFENQYHLNTHFYRHRKYAAFTLMQSEDTMIPKPVLSEYVKLISGGKIKQSNLPFEFTIGFQMEQRDKIEMVIKSIKDFLHRYYSERSGKFVSLHFWSKEDGEAALKQLQNEFQTVEFRCSYNITKQEEEIAEGDIFQVQFQAEQPSLTQPESTQEEENPTKPNLQIETEGKKETEPSEQIQKSEKKSLPVPQEVPQKKKIPVQGEGQPRQIGRKTIPTFRKNDYPSSKQNVQDIYQLDEQQLFGEAVDWSKFVATLCSKKMGPEATEWKIRTLLMVSSFHNVQETYFHDQFAQLIQMYSKDKEAAMRILQIQRIDSKSVKGEMEGNGIYLSHHEPEMLSYLQIYNYLSEDKIPLTYPQIIVQTQEIQKTQQIIEAVEKRDYRLFYEYFISSDYVYSCSLIPFVHCLRQAVIEDILKGARLSAKDLYKLLLFNSKEELQTYFEKNGFTVDVRVSKSTKEEIYVLKQGEKSKENIENNTFIKEVVFEKRDKKYFFLEPKELYKEQYFTLSFFAFGDFKESINSTYINNLVKLLKDKQE